MISLKVWIHYTQHKGVSFFTTKVRTIWIILRSLKLHLIGIRNLTVKVDAKYIKGMLSNPDIAPSASINCWILLILMFHFKLIHISGA